MASLHVRLVVETRWQDGSSKQKHQRFKSYVYRPARIGGKTAFHILSRVSTHSLQCRSCALAQLVRMMVGKSNDSKSGPPWKCCFRWKGLSK